MTVIACVDPVATFHVKVRKLDPSIVTVLPDPDVETPLAPTIENELEDGTTAPESVATPPTTLSSAFIVNVDPAPVVPIPTFVNRI